MQRVRRVLDRCNTELQPLRIRIARHKVSHNELWSLMFKWAIAGLLLYLTLYTTFFFWHHRYGVDRSGILLQYKNDLSQCWHELSASPSSSAGVVLHEGGPGRIGGDVAGTFTTYHPTSHRTVANYNTETSNYTTIIASTDINSSQSSITSKPFYLDVHPSRWSVGVRHIDASSFIDIDDSTNVNSSNIANGIHAGKLEQPLYFGVRSVPRTIVSYSQQQQQQKQQQRPSRYVETQLDAGYCLQLEESQPLSMEHNNHYDKVREQTSNLRSARSSSSNLKHGSVRCLPSFHIIGAMKCGTGELMKWLQLHPQLASRSASGSGMGSGGTSGGTSGDGEAKREVHFFSSPATLAAAANAGAGAGANAGVGVGAGAGVGAGVGGTSVAAPLGKSNRDAPIQRTHADTQHAEQYQQQQQQQRLFQLYIQYAQYFPAFTSLQTQNVYTFAKAPDYIRSRAALEVMRRLLPNTQLIVLLRDPVIRVLSEFVHHCRHGRYARVLRDVTVTIPTASAKTSNQSGSSGDLTPTLHLTKHQIIRIISSSSSSSSSSGSSSADVEGLDTSLLPRNSYKVLSYPCAAADARAYLYSSAYSSSSSNWSSFPNNTTTATTAVGTDSQLVPEVRNGFYDLQLATLFNIFPPTQVLVLLQEDMYSHTFRTLRLVEAFLKLPCFDFTKVMLLSPPSTNPASGSGSSSSSDASDSGTSSSPPPPPVRIPATDREKWNLFFSRLKQFLASWDSSGGSDAGSGGGGGESGSVLQGKGGSLAYPSRRIVLAQSAMSAVARTLSTVATSSSSSFSSSPASASASASTVLLRACEREDPVFLHWLRNTVYRPHNQQLSFLLHGTLGYDAFSAQHLRDNGWTI